ncbi:hypothetical protein D9613_004070 [Agrocybe pediades]|uniref:TPR-like protein n=1 Tax=Agrocybe pediades TaxID=84607 RepID=A0A8H4QKB2_9AGAR|nr:hypothetical protein D9613_004070 [Agrocybe pediades]
MPPNAQTCGPNQNAERLKTEGNAFHVTGKYREAYKKYSEAIKEDPTNAVYYANRAASSLAMKEFMDASSDSQKATELDPTYAKAWGRLASARFALGMWTMSEEAYRSALKCLPTETETITEADKKLRAQFLEGLQKSKNAKASNVAFKNAITVKQAQGSTLPWQKAAAHREEFAKAGKYSSAFVILHAYEEFHQGVTSMKSLAKKPVNGQLGYFGRNDALVGLTNGIMRDSRVFHIDSSDWVDKYNDQVMFESTHSNAWTTGGPQTIKQDAVTRLKNQGWDKVRPAISTTIRAWIMRGFMAQKAQQQHLVALEYYSQALEVLEWGHRKWEDVPTSDRGVVFESTFIRGVKHLRLAALFECLSSKTKGCKYNKEDIATWSRDMIAEIDADPPPFIVTADPGFLPSFWLYPKAEALGTLGWYYMQLGLGSNVKEDAFVNFSLSADYYLQAAATYPDDDENALIFLAVVFEAYVFQGKPLKDVFAITAQIDRALPNVLKIWENSPNMDPKRSNVFAFLEFGYECMNRVEAGTLSLDAVVKPKSIQRTDKWKTPDVIYI